MSTKRQQQQTEPLHITDATVHSEVSIFKDIRDMHQKFGVHETVSDMTSEQFVEYLRFRVSMIKEEYDETVVALNDGDAEEFVDGIIDMIVFAAGTLDVIGVDAERAWTAVHEANMGKRKGVNKSRPNKFGFPDMVKPKNWEAPSHTDNHGLLTDLNFGRDPVDVEDPRQLIMEEPEL